MSQMRTWVLVVVVVVGCSKGEKAPGSASVETRSEDARMSPVLVPTPPVAEGTPIPGCSSDAGLTREQLAPVYHAWKKDPYGSLYDDVQAMSLVTLTGGVIELQSHPCCDIPLGHIGYAWHCKLYPNKRSLEQELATDRGWLTAEVAKRIEIATALDPFFADVVATKPPNWNPYKLFASPIAEATRDGGVKLTRWVRITEGGGFGGPRHSYALQEDTIAPTAWHTTKELERYRATNNGYADPKVLTSCNPAKPPTKEWIHAMVVDTQPYHRVSFRSLLIEHVYEDVWLAMDASSAPTRSLAYFRRCKMFNDRVAVAPAILQDRGWATANAAKRVELAEETDTFVYRALLVPDADWPSKHPFVRPTSRANPDGSVTLSRWVLGRGDNDVSENTYAHIDTVYSAAGVIIVHGVTHDSFGMYSDRR